VTTNSTQACINHVIVKHQGFSKLLV